MSIRPIFATGISIFNLKNVNNSEIVEYAMKNSNVNKAKDIRDIITNNIFTELNKVIEQKINDHYHEIYNNRYKITLIEAWSNFGNDDIITMPHMHTTSFLSAVYYPQAKDGEIIFLNPMSGLLSKQYIDMIDQHSPYTSECFSVPTRTGDLVIFNSMLMHFVKCPRKTNRVSIAYNGIIEEKEKLGLQFGSDGKPIFLN